MAKERYLYLKGCAGLGNRLITLLAAVNYANATGRKLYIDWTDGMFAAKGINAFDLFFDISDVQVCDRSEIINKLNTGSTIFPSSITQNILDCDIWDNYRVVGAFLGYHVPPYRVLISKIVSGKPCAIFGLQSWQLKSDRTQNFFHYIKNVFNETNIQLGHQLSKNINKDIVLYVDFRPYCDTSKMFDTIHLKPEYEHKFTEFVVNNKLQQAAIGVHVRATDKQPRKQLDKLKNIIEKLLQDNPSNRIFLSTDNVFIQQEFFKSYGEKIITYPKYLPEDLKGRGIHNMALDSDDPTFKIRLFEESLADMWILSMCKMLVWQGNSSFSYISQILKTDKENIINWMK